jgi:hypothetical protein
MATTVAKFERQAPSSLPSPSSANHSSSDSNDAPTNPRGIPVAPFVDKVEDYITDSGQVESTINSFKEMISYAPKFHNTRRTTCMLILREGNTSSWKPRHIDEQQDSRTRFPIYRRRWTRCGS